MQSYPLALNGSVPATSIGVDADLFVYESGENTARTNLMKYSESFDNAIWSATNSSVTANTVVAPDGSTTADTVTISSLAGYIQQGCNIGSPGTYTTSVYIKAGTISGSQFRLREAFYFGTSTTFDITLGTVVSGTGSIINVGNGWFRCSMQTTYEAGQTSYYVLIEGLATGSFYIWGAQLEEGPNATKYIQSVATPGTSTDGDTRILVKPENGAEIILKPGQRFRIVDKASRWFVRSYDAISPINGSVIIGSGEFEDSNTANTFKLDGTFTNSVNINNTPAQRIPVTLDTTQVLNIAGNTVQYTHSFADTSVTAVTAQVIFSPASNPNGAYLELVETSILQANVNNHFSKLSLIAKASAPTSSVDGDVVYLNHTSMYTTATGVTQLAFNDKQTTRIKIPAGKGLYLNLENAVSDPQKCSKTVLYTLL